MKLNNGQTIPPIGFGTWKILLNGRAKKAVANALKDGYRLIDTARIYGNEKGVGQAIRESDIDRSEIFVTTKLWNSDQGYDSGLKAFDKSLSRLGLDYVDLYLLHWPVAGKRLDSWRALQEIYKSGRSRSIGVSNFTVKHLQELINSSGTMPVVNQIEFHPFLYKDQLPTIKFCQDHGIVVEAYSPLAHGHRMKDPVIAEIAKQHGKTNSQVMLRWCIQHNTIPLPKSDNPNHIRENFDIFDFELSDADMENINKLSDGTRTCWDPNKIP